MDGRVNVKCTELVVKLTLIDRFCFVRHMGTGDIVLCSVRSNRLSGELHAPTVLFPQEESLAPIV